MLKKVGYFVLALLVSGILGTYFMEGIGERDGALAVVFTIGGFLAPHLCYVVWLYSDVMGDWDKDEEAGLLVDRADDAGELLTEVARALRKGTYDDDLVDCLYSFALFVEKEGGDWSRLRPLADMLLTWRDEAKFAAVEAKQREEIAAFLETCQVGGNEDA